MQNQKVNISYGKTSFVTTITLSNGVPIETVSKMLGHSSIKTTQHYAKIIDSKTSYDRLFYSFSFHIFAKNEISGYPIQFIFCPAGCSTMPGQGRYDCKCNASQNSEKSFTK